MYRAVIRFWGKDAKTRLTNEVVKLMKQNYLLVYNKWADMSEDVYKKVNADAEKEGIPIDCESEAYLEYVASKVRPFIDECGRDVQHFMQFCFCPETGQFVGKATHADIYMDVILKEF